MVEKQYVTQCNKNWPRGETSWPLFLWTMQAIFLGININGVQPNPSTPKRGKSFYRF